MYFNILDVSVVAFVLFYGEAQNRGECSSNTNGYSWGNIKDFENGPCCICCIVLYALVGCETMFHLSEGRFLFIWCPRHKVVEHNVIL